MVTQDQIIEVVKERMRHIQNERVYYSLRKMNVHAMKETVETVSCCLALQEIGVPITVFTIQSLMGKSVEAIRPRMHTLGDRHVLVLTRHERKNGTIERELLWKLSEVFLKCYHGEE